MNKEELISTLKKMRLTATDAVALEVKELYPMWKPDVRVEDGDRLNYGGKLYRVLNGKAHTTQSDWKPDTTPSLFEVIDVEHTGTFDDPIPFSLGMEVFNGKCYTYEGAMYKCIRDSGQPLYHAPNTLINTYFEKI